MKLPKRKKTLPISHPYFLLWAFSMLIVASYFYWDRQISEWVLAAPRFLGILCCGMNILSGPSVWILVLPLLFYVFRTYYKNETLANLFLLMAITVNATHLLVIPIKMLFGRHRPELWINQHLYGFDFFATKDISMSFPSGYAVTIASILFSIACVYPKKFPWLLILTFVLSFCRVIAEQHFVSDILASMLLALFASQWIYITLKKAKIPF